MDASTAALGRSYVSRAAASCAGLNQAGLGLIEIIALALHHTRPFIIADLDITSLSAQFALQHGSIIPENGEPAASLGSIQIECSYDHKAIFSDQLLKQIKVGILTGRILKEV